MSVYRAVIFDLDGVIVSTDECHYRAWKNLSDSEGIPFDRRVNERLRGVSRVESLEIILENSARVYSEEEKAALAESKNEKYKELICALTPRDILPGVTQFMEFLRARGIKLAIGSSSRNTKTILEHVGLEKSFDVVVDGNCIHRSKPDPEVFVLAAKRLQIPSCECIVVEDAAAGVVAGVAAGCDVFAVGSAVSECMARYRANNLENIPQELLFSLNAVREI